MITKVYFDSIMGTCLRLQYIVVDDSVNHVIPMQDTGHTTPINSHVFCEGNNDQMFLPLVDRHKGVFKNVPGMWLPMYVATYLMLYIIGTHIVAYYDPSSSTIRHVNCQFHIKQNSRSRRCKRCQGYRYVLHDMLRRFKKNSTVEMSRCHATSHANFRYLRTPEKLEKFRQMRIALNQQNRKVKKLELSLEKANQVDGILVDKNTNEDLVSIMSSNSGAIESINNKRFQSIFLEQQLKAKSCKGK